MRHLFLIVYLLVFITETAYGSTQYFDSISANTVTSSTINNKVNIRKYASLTAAVTAIGSTPTELEIDTTTTLTANTTIPSTLALSVTPLGRINQGTYTLAINGPFSAGLYQVFTGTGAITGLKESWPEWFGVGSAAIEAAAAAAPNVELVAPLYDNVSNVNIPAGRTLYSNSGSVIKLATLASLDFSPIFNVIGSGVEFRGLKFDGNRANQPADGFSDSWNTGGNGTGKSNRSAIKMETPYNGLKVHDCEFYEFWGASIATRDVSDIDVFNNNFHDNNFEGIFAYLVTAASTNKDIKVTHNTFNNIASGDATVNANCMAISGYTGVDVSHNYADTFERNLVKLEICNDADVSHNTISNNTIVGFNALQAQSGGNNIRFTHNTLRNVQKGLLVSTGTFTNVVVDGNTFDTVSAASGTPDAIGVIDTTGLTITNNKINDVGRYGIYVSAADYLIEGNTVTNASNSGYPGLYVIQGSNSSYVHIKNNVFVGNQSINDGIVVINGAGVVNSFEFSGNTLKGVSATNNRGLYSSGYLRYTGSIHDNIFLDNAGLTIYPVDVNKLTAYNNNCTNIVSPLQAALSTPPRTRAAAPVSGIWKKGEIIYSTAPTAGGFVGWIVTTAGHAVTGSWTTATAYTLGNYVSNAGNIYVALNSGTSGATAPTHTSGDVSDGAVTWGFVATSATTAVFKTFGAITP